jgi:hypothetical protein
MRRRKVPVTFLGAVSNSRSRDVELSPQKARHTRSSPRYLAAKAIPVQRESWPDVAGQVGARASGHRGRQAGDGAASYVNTVVNRSLSSRAW